MTDLRSVVARSLSELGVEPDEPIGVACSGGADSIALLHLFADRPNVTAVHIDHHLRADSTVDAEFVGEVCDRLELPCVVRDVRPSSPAEAAARDMRYQALSDVAREHGLRAVLTAHTRDDQAETVLLRLMRGDALDGIAPVRGIFVRPLLDVTRAELRDWLTAYAIAWREDPTNSDVRYERNWARHVLLPQLHERRAGVSSVLARTAARARDDALALDAIATNIVAECASDDVGVFIADTSGLPRAILTRVIRTASRRLGHDPSAHDVDAVAAMRRHVRTGSVDAWRLDEGIAFTRAPLATPSPLDVPSDGVLESAAWGVVVRVPPNQRLRLRSRRPGDRVRTSAGTRKVQDVLVDAKVPRVLRPLVPILADARDEPLAVVCGRVRSPLVVGAEPFRQTWSRQRAWIS